MRLADRRDMNRREFILGSSGVAVCGAMGAMPAGTYDVLVAGAGPAGLGAAVTAARQGRSVLLLEAAGAPGGIWTTGLMSVLIEMGGSRLRDEVTARLKALGSYSERYPGASLGTHCVCEPEVLKRVCDELCQAKGLRLRLHTRVIGVQREGRRILRVITESKSGSESWTAGIFVDATGDGDLAARAGAGFDVGGDGGGAEQPASLLATVLIPPSAELNRFVVNDPSNFNSSGEPVAPVKTLFRQEIERGGFRPSYAKPGLFRLHGPLYMLMANHLFDVPVDDADRITEATLAGRREVWRTVDALRSLGGPWREIHLVATSAQLAHRRARRIHGRYRLSVDDLLKGKRFEREVADCTFGVDVHAVDRAAKSAEGDRYGRSVIKTYGIPFESCCSADFDNLHMVGRCISGDFQSQASYRISGAAMAMGEGLFKYI